MYLSTDIEIKTAEFRQIDKHRKIKLDQFRSIDAGQCRPIYWQWNTYKDKDRYVDTERWTDEELLKYISRGKEADICFL